MVYDKQKVIDIALAEVGYLEKITNEQLDDKTANAGNKNYTKYARDLAAYPFYNSRKYGVAWCDVFVDWCFVKAYGLQAALELTCQPTIAANNCGAGCKFSRNYYKNKGQLYSTPQPGDQVFFYSRDKSSISHTGLVYKVSATKLYTVEGNTSGASGVVANGGGVCKKSYSLTYSRLAGFGRPNWGEVTLLKEPEAITKPKETSNASTDYDLISFIKDIQRACFATIDGIADPETLRRTVTVSANRNRRHAVVKPIQKRLYALGYKEVGVADGIAGPKFTAAVKNFQNRNGCVVDGIITARNKTWRKLLEME